MVVCENHVVLKRCPALVSQNATRLLARRARKMYKNPHLLGVVRSTLSGCTARSNTGARSRRESLAVWNAGPCSTSWALFQWDANTHATANMKVPRQLCTRLVLEQTLWWWRCRNVVRWDEIWLESNRAHNECGNSKLGLEGWDGGLVRGDDSWGWKGF